MKLKIKLPKLSIEPFGLNDKDRLLLIAFEKKPIGWSCSHSSAFNNEKFSEIFFRESCYKLELVKFIRNEKGWYSITDKGREFINGENFGN